MVQKYDFEYKVLYRLSFSTYLCKTLNKITNMSSYTELDELLLEDTVVVEEKKLVLFNDEVNSFDIETRLKVLLKTN